jgi:quinol monooxygenase YgiN
MFGSVFRLTPLPGHEQTMIELMERWNRERRPKVEGFVAAYVYKSESRSGEYVNAVVFKDRESYMKNADDPEQDRWYREIRAHLASDPEWEDGEVVYAM